MTVMILIPAAGASSRMGGRDKLLEPVGGQPLLARQVQVALATGAPVAVTLPPDRPRRAEALAPLAAPGLQILPVKDPSEGIAASLRAGAEAALARTPVPDGLMVLLADLPELTTSNLATVIAAFETAPDQPLRATDAAGQPGHPAILPRRLFAALRGLTGDEGARPILAGEQTRLIPLPGQRAVTDLDTPEAWAAWREKQKQYP